MMVFDTLSQLESYQQVVPEIKSVITVLDRSLPYEQGNGRYEVPEDKRIKYQIDTAMTSDKGFPAPCYPGMMVMEIVLEGEEVIAVDGSVAKLAEGRFALYPGDGGTKRGLSFGQPVFFKAVRFIFQGK